MATPTAVAFQNAGPTQHALPTALRALSGRGFDVDGAKARTPSAHTSRRIMMRVLQLKAKTRTIFA